MTKKADRLPAEAQKVGAAEHKADTGDPKRLHRAGERTASGNAGPKKVKLVREDVPVVDMQITPRADRSDSRLRGIRAINERREARKHRNAGE